MLIGGRNLYHEINGHEIEIALSERTSLFGFDRITRHSNG